MFFTHKEEFLDLHPFLPTCISAVCADAQSAEAQAGQFSIDFTDASGPPPETIDVLKSAVELSWNIERLEFELETLIQHGEGPSDVEAISTTLESLRSKLGKRDIWDLVMLDLTEEHKYPSVMDVKIGTCRCTPYMLRHKVAKVFKNEAGKLTEKAGVRFCGAVHHIIDRTGVTRYETCGKDIGYSAESIQDLRQLFLSFFGSATMHQPSQIAHPLQSSHTLALCRAALAAVNAIESFFIKKKDSVLKNWAMVSTSLLFIYDASVFGSPELDTNAGCRVWLIDFGRSGPREFHFDEVRIGFLKGLGTLRSILSQEDGDDA
jgi:hypothetical protein